MELTITRGRGYVSADKGKTDDMPIGVIAVDAIYTPVDRVNMVVENTRVGQVTKLYRLILDVFTNGTLDPDEAVSLAAKVLSEHLSLFIDLSENAKTAEVMIEKEDNEKEKILEMSIDELELSVRFYNCLKRAGINTVEELCNRTSEDMMKVRNLGRKSLERGNCKSPRNWACSFSLQRNKIHLFYEYYRGEPKHQGSKTEQACPGVPQMEENNMAKYRKLSRTSDQRKALLRNQVTNLLYHGKIVTTEKAKAKRSANRRRSYCYGCSRKRQL